ncbi:MAG: putative bifunctional diguanylate cyclase/phosphodiesterase [Acidimicrobiales bacterium]
MNEIQPPEEPRDTELSVIVSGLAKELLELKAIVVLPLPEHAPAGSNNTSWLAPNCQPGVIDVISEAVANDVTGAVECLFDDGLRLSVWPEAIRLANGPTMGILAVARAPQQGWAEEERHVVKVFADLCASAWARAAAEYQGDLDDLVIEVATRLMSASAETYASTLEWALTKLADFLHADAAFIRKHDRAQNASILVANYPPRDFIPDPDPLAVVPFDSDPVFAALKDLKKPFVSRKSKIADEYSDRVKVQAGIADFSGAAVPLLKQGVTDGCIGFLQFYDAQWTQLQINALQAVAAMLVQLDARIEAETRVQYLALHDDLTGLPNRRALMAEITRRLEVQSDCIAVLVLGLDRFKYMNDYLGQIAGDRILITTADRVRMSVRPGDFTARLGGDEFVIVMSGVGGELAAIATANRLLALVSKPLEVSAQHVAQTASVGIAFGEGGSSTTPQVLGNADFALFAAKNQGRDRVVVFDDVLRLEVDQRSDMETMLRDAIAQGGLRVYYQPEIDMVSGQIVGVEALVRCEHTEKGIISAGEFIAVAEETGLVVDLGRWVLEESCRQMRLWQDRYPGLDLLMRVNMSPAQLSSPGITEHISRCLRQSNLLGSSLCLEITEHVVMQDVERAIVMLNEFRSLGVRLAMDDFGTGFSSMAQLKRIPIDTLKIDMGFVIGLAKDPADQAIVEAIVHLAEAFGLEVVAEGVEDLADMRELLRLGCTRAQGFLLGKPMPADELDPLLWRGVVELKPG